MKQRASAIVFLALLILLQVAAVWMIPNYGGQDVDQFWLRWISDAETYGLIDGYRISTLDYPPLSVLLLWCFSRVGAVLGVGTHLGLKLGLFAFLNITVALFGYLTRDLRLTLVLMAGLIINSVCLSYVDVLFMPPLLLSFWCLLNNRFRVGLLCFTLSALIKYQPLIIAPFIVLYLWRKGALNVRTVWPSAMAVLVCLAIYGLECFVTLGRALNHLYLSAYAFNLNWITTRILESGLMDHPFMMRYGMVFLSQVASVLTKSVFMVFYAYMLFRSRWNSFRGCLLSATAAYIAYYALSTGVHENHLMLAVLSMSYVASLDRRRIMDAAFVAAYSTLNMVYIYGVDGNGGLLETQWELDVVLCIVFLAWFVRLVLPLLKRSEATPQEGAFESPR